ncbi:MAG: hypothetical protein E7111_01295 [Bacteroidales bacterium]|nr:hypothetical protein [Bacteroidales bacterium]
MKLMAIFCALLTANFIDAQEIDLAEAVAGLLGENEIEAIDPEIMESLENLAACPIDINASSISVLESYGILTHYQLASLRDYRLRHGDLHSYTELSAVDGFSADFVRLLSSFIKIGLPSVTQGTSPQGFKGELALRGGYKAYTEKQMRKSTYAAKFRGSYSDKAVVSFSATEPYDSMKAWPTVYSGNVAWMHRYGKVIAGDFNARFGQGLALWNTASFSSLTSPSVFMKRPAGFSPTNSYTATTALTGLAADFLAGRWKLSGMLAMPGIKHLKARPDRFMLNPALNLSRYFRYGHMGITHTMTFSSFLEGDYWIPQMLSSLDASICIKGVNLFGECMYDWVSRSVSFVTGQDCGIGERFHLACLVRYLPVSNEHGAALSGQFRTASHEVILSADGLYHPQSKSKDGRESYQMKAQVNWDWAALPGLHLKLRLSERIRTWGNLSRTALRADLKYDGGRWNSTLRLEALYGVAFACLGYLEGGYKSEKLSIYLRYGMFDIDNWDDRIYVYERDARGNFNVPSFYGRGLWTSAYMKWKFARWGSLDLRAIYKNPGSAEVKTYLVFLF